MTVRQRAPGDRRSPSRCGEFAAASTAGNALYALVLAGNGATLLPDALIGPRLAVPMLLPVAAWLIWRRLARRADSADRISTPKELP